MLHDRNSKGGESGQICGAGSDWLRHVGMHGWHAPLQDALVTGQPLPLRTRTFVAAETGKHGLEFTILLIRESNSGNRGPEDEIARMFRSCLGASGIIAIDVHRAGDGLDTAAFLPRGAACHG